jgi:hypothetical protein
MTGSGCLTRVASKGKERVVIYGRRASESSDGDLKEEDEENAGEGAAVKEEKEENEEAGHSGDGRLKLKLLRFWTSRYRNACFKTIEFIV